VHRRHKEEKKTTTRRPPSRNLSRRPSRLGSFTGVGQGDDQSASGKYHRVVPKLDDDEDEIVLKENDEEDDIAPAKTGEDAGDGNSADGSDDVRVPS